MNLLFIVILICLAFSFGCFLKLRRNRKEQEALLNEYRKFFKDKEWREDETVYIWYEADNEIYNAPIHLYGHSKNDLCQELSDYIESNQDLKGIKYILDPEFEETFREWNEKLKRNKWDLDELLMKVYNW